MIGSTSRNTYGRNGSGCEGAHTWLVHLIATSLADTGTPSFLDAAATEGRVNDDGARDL
jgi:hypothetical protein